MTEYTSLDIKFDLLYLHNLVSTPVADLGGRPRGPAPPPFQTRAYIVYYFDGKRMNNLT